MVARAPGRVNLIGDHTDYVGGLALPMAIDLATVVEGWRLPPGAPGGDRVELRSTELDGVATVALDVADPAAVGADLGPLRGRGGGRDPAAAGLRRHGHHDHPRGHRPLVQRRAGGGRRPGPGRSRTGAPEADSAATARACRREPESIELARACQRAEQRASGVPCGIMDQLTIVAAQAGHALLIDFRTLRTQAVPMPEDVEVVVVPSGQQRELATSAYAERRRQLEAATAVVGPLRDATLADLARIGDDRVQARARHVITENARVRAVAEALAAGDAAAAGELMVAGHVSFRDDFEASTPVVDALVAKLVATPGVFGARLTGGGFGGCVVALSEPGALARGMGGARAREERPSRRGDLRPPSRCRSRSCCRSRPGS